MAKILLVRRNFSFHWMRAFLEAKGVYYYSPYLHQDRKTVRTEQSWYRQMPTHSKNNPPCFEWASSPISPNFLHSRKVRFLSHVRPPSLSLRRTPYIAFVLNKILSLSISDHMTYHMLRTSCPWMECIVRVKYGISPLADGICRPWQC